MNDGIEKLGFVKMKELSLDNIYCEIRNGLLNYEKLIPLNASSAIVNNVISAILHDSPEIFWFEGKWRVAVDNKQIKYMAPVYNMDRESVKIVQKQIEERLEELDCLYSNSTKYDIARGIYQWMLKNVEYGLDANNGGQNVYNALVKKKAVCKGIAKTYQLILLRYGIFSALAVGSIDGKTRHVWNVISLDDNFYNVDICMGYERFAFLYTDELRNDNLRRGFLLSDKQMERTHIWQQDYPYRIECVT